MQKVLHLIPLVAIMIYLIIQLYLICSRLIKVHQQSRYTVADATKIDMSAINGSQCLIVGNHPFKDYYGMVAGSSIYRGRWSLVVHLKDQPGTYCYVFENKNLLFL